jgi:hypothetical protein
MVKVQTQGRNIRHYTNYLTERAKAYRDVKCDWVRAAEHRLEKMPVDKGLLRETEIVQHQIIALLKCDVSPSIPKGLYQTDILARCWKTSRRTRLLSQCFECWC